LPDGSEFLEFRGSEFLELTILDINRLLYESRHFLQRLIGNRFALEIVSGVDLFPVKMNASQAQQIITNLLANARDAMPEGGTLVIESGALNLNHYHSNNQTEIPAGRYTTLAVVDTGRGMDAETRSHIFEPFFTTKESGKGTGLGLAMVNEILKQNGAFASVESNVGSGTTVKIFLPAAADAKARELPFVTGAKFATARSHEKPAMQLFRQSRIRGGDSLSIPGSKAPEEKRRR